MRVSCSPRWQDAAGTPAHLGEGPGRSGKPTASAVSQMWVHCYFQIKSLFFTYSPTTWMCFVTDRVHTVHNTSRHAACLNSPTEWLGHVALGYYLRVFDLSSQEWFQGELMFTSVKHNLKPCFRQGNIHSPEADHGHFICPCWELLKTDFFYI